MNFRSSLCCPEVALALLKMNAIKEICHIVYLNVTMGSLNDDFFLC